MCQNLARTSRLWEERLLALPPSQTIRRSQYLKINPVIVNYEAALDQTITERNTLLSSLLRREENHLSQTLGLPKV